MENLISIENIDINDLAKELERNAARKKSHPSSEEQVYLISKFKSGDRSALNELVDRNQRLVISIANHYTSDPDFLGDLIQEGNLGLIRSIEKFESSFDVKFSTYASIWIRSNIESYISKTAYNMKVPQHSRKLASKVIKTHDKLKNKGLLGAELFSEIANQTNVSEDAARKLIALRTANINLQDKRSAAQEDGGTIQDTIESNLCTESSATKDQEKKIVEKLIDGLPEKQKEVIRFFYGISNYPQCESFSEVSRFMGISREYVRILYNKSMDEMSKAAKEDKEKVAI